jgi:hypothetical protein
MPSAREARQISLVEIGLHPITTLAFRPFVTYFLLFHPTAAIKWIVAGQSTEKRGPQVRRAASMFSIRRSGMSHRSAANTYRLKETHCHQKATGMATAYRIGDSLPFQSPPTAFLRIESGPCDAMIICCSIQYATAAIRRTTPYNADGAAAKWFSPIQPVANGTRDSQNKRCRFAQSIDPVTFRHACSIWWCLFQ